MKRFRGLALCLILGLFVLVWWSTRSSTGKQDARTQNPQQPGQASLSSTTLKNQKQKSNLPSSTVPPQASSGGAEKNDEGPSPMRARDYRGTVVRESLGLKRPVDERDLKTSALTQDSWKIVTNLYALPIGRVSESARAKALGVQSGFVFFASRSLNADEAAMQAGRSLVVYDPVAQAYGVLTGTVQIQVSPGTDISDLLSRSNATVEHSFPGTGTYFVQSADPVYDLRIFKSSLEQDSRVKSAEVEIVSRHYAKQ